MLVGMGEADGREPATVAVRHPGPREFGIGRPTQRDLRTGSVLDRGCRRL